LEIRIKEAFEFLSVEKVDHEPNGVHGPDLIMEHNKIGFTIEVEGSKGSIKTDKARQLLQWIAEAPADHKGVLIGNPHRELDPVERPPKNHEFFVKEAEELADKRDFVLITSFDIFQLICRKIRQEEINIDELVFKISSSKGYITLV